MDDVPLKLIAVLEIDTTVPPSDHIQVKVDGRDGVAGSLGLIGDIYVHIGASGIVIYAEMSNP